MEAARSDQRREAGLRTQARLLEAALTLISERGEDGVTLRELTDAAGANCQRYPSKSPCARCRIFGRAVHRSVRYHYLRRFASQ